MKKRAAGLIVIFWFLLTTLAAAAQSEKPQPQTGVVVNDVHSRLNETRVQRIVTPASVEQVQAVVRQARAEGRPISIAGGRHAMGGQQFGTDTILLDTSKMNRLLSLDRRNGILEVQAGIRWP